MLSEYRWLATPNNCCHLFFIQFKCWGGKQDIVFFFYSHSLLSMVCKINLVIQPF